MTVEGLMKMSDPELVKMLERYNCSNEDVSRLTKALKNLRLWTGLIFSFFSNHDFIE